MTRQSSFALLTLSLALLVPGLLSAKVEPASKTFEIAPPEEVWPYSHYIAQHVETTAISLGSQGFVVGWVTEAANGREGDYGTRVAWLRPNGSFAQAFNPTTIIDEGGGAGDLCLASLEGGSFVSAATITAYPDLAILYRRFAAGHDPLDPESVPLAGTLGPPSNYTPRIASNGKGLFVIAWTSSEAPYTAPAQRLAQVYDADSQPVSPEIVVSTSQQNIYGGTAVGMDAEGNFVVLWTDLSSPLHPIWGQRFDQTENPLGKPFVIGNQGKNVGDVAMTMAPSGEFVVAWRDTAKPRFMLLSRFTADGRRIRPVTWLPYKGTDPAMALDPSGRVALFWLDAQLPKLAVFDATLRPLGPVASGTPTRIGGDYPPARVGVAFGDDGRILTTWIGIRGNRSRASVLGRFWQIR